MDCICAENVMQVLWPMADTTRMIRLFFFFFITYKFTTYCETSLVTSIKLKNSFVICLLLNRLHTLPVSRGPNVVNQP